MENASKEKYMHIKQKSFLGFSFAICFCVVVSVIGMIFTPVVAMASEDKSGIEVVLPNMIEFVPMLLAFIVVAIVLYKFGWPKFEGMLEKRENKIRDALKDSEAKRAEAENLLEQYKKKLKDAENECEELIKSSKLTAMELSNKITDEAKEKADIASRKSKLNIEQAKKIAEQEIKTEAVDIAVSLTSKIISEEMSEEEHRKLIERYLAKSGSLAK